MNAQEATEEECENERDVNFVKNLERLGIKFCKENVIILTRLRIPLYVCFIASLGTKFNYYDDDVKKNGGNDRKDNLFKYLIIFEKLKDMVEDFMCMNVLRRELTRFRNKYFLNNFRERTTAPSAAQLFIKLQMDRTRTFLSKNQDVKVVPADKGGKVIITDLHAYKTKMRLYLDLNTKTRIYFRYKEFSFDYVKEICESKYGRIRTVFNEFFENDRLVGFKNLGKFLLFEPFIMSRIYGLFKMHKEDHPVRPIISATNCLGEPLSDWIRTKLKIIAKHVGKHQVRNAHDLFKELDGKQLNGDNHVLFTLDFENMFTNIPFQTTKDIIKKFYYLIAKETTVPLDVFLDALTFLVEECSFFSFEDEIYLQAEGLAMGNSLSQILAEITTSYLLNEALERINSDKISFLFKYVDDLIGAVDKDCLMNVKGEIERSHGGMKLKMTVENSKNEVDYLQLRIRREVTDNNSIYVRWMQKEFGAKRILDFHSFHPYRMKLNVVREFIRNALKLTSEKYLNLSINMIRKTLANSNYSYYFIYTQINAVKNELCDDQVKNNLCKASRRNIGKVTKRKFISCPYRPGPMNFIRKTIKRSDLKLVSLVPSMCNNNERLVFANLKDKRKLGCMTFSSFVVRCKDCNFSRVLFANRYDIERTYKFALNNCKSEINVHCRDSGHNMHQHVARKDITQYRNRIDLNYVKRNKLYE